MCLQYIGTFETLKNLRYSFYITTKEGNRDRALSGSGLQIGNDLRGKYGKKTTGLLLH